MTKETKALWQANNRERCRAASRRWYLRNKDKSKVSSKRWQENNKEYFNEVRRRWREENKERYRATTKAYAQRNRERNNANMQRWRDANRELVRERDRIKKRRWYADPEKRKEITDRARAWRKANPEKVRRSHLRKILKKLGASETEYDAAMELQGGKCAICGCMPTSKSLAVDHCHKTNAFRGILCESCNLGLGMFKDDPRRLVLAAVYLARPKGSACGA